MDSIVGRPGHVVSKLLSERRFMCKPLNLGGGSDWALLCGFFSSPPPPPPDHQSLPCVFP